MQTIIIEHPNGVKEELNIHEALTALAMALGNEGRRLEALEGDARVFTMQATKENNGPWRDRRTGEYVKPGE